MSCNKNKTLIRFKYYFYGDYPPPIRLAVQYSNSDSGTWNTIPTNSLYNDEVLAELNTDNVVGTYCYIRFVSLNEQEQVIDILSRKFIANIKKYVQDYRLTSTLGNEVIANNQPFSLTLTTIPENPYFYYNFYNPFGEINNPMRLYGDQSFYVTNAYSDCGFVNVTDTVKVKFTPQLISTNISSFPCRSSQKPLVFTYQVLNRFPEGTVLRFFILNSNNSEKFFIGQTSLFEGWISTIIPSNVPIGTYKLGYESVDGIFS